MATVVQSRTGAAAGANRAATAALSSTATVGNRLYCWLAVDKDAGSDPTFSSGWSVVRDDSGNALIRRTASITFGLYTKIAEGTSADQCVFGWTTGLPYAWSIIETDLTSAATHRAIANWSDGTTAVTSVALSALTAPGDGLAFASVAVDTLANWTSGVSGNYTNGFSESLVSTNDCGITHGWIAVNRNDSVSTTVSSPSGGSDQASGIFIVVGEDSGGGVQAVERDTANPGTAFQDVDIITARAAGAWAIVTADAAVAIPAGTVQDDRMYLFATWKAFGTTATVADWTEVTEFADGSVAAGANVGSVKVGCWYKDHDGSETDPTIGFSTGPVPAAAVIVSFQKPSTTRWDELRFATAAISAATNWTATASSDPGVTAGDLLLGLVGFRDDSATMTRSTTTGLTAAGITWEADYAEFPTTHASSTTSNDISADAGYRVARSGTGSAAPTMAGTLSASETGAALFIRQRVVVDSSPQTIEGVQAVEVDTANVGTTVQTLLGTLASEIDAANTGAITHILTGAQGIERDTAQEGAIVVGPVTVDGAQAAERDTANSGESVQTITGLQSVEVDVANAGDSVQTLTGTQAVERDTALGGLAPQFIDGEQAVEIDVANAGASLVIVTGEQSVEIDVANSGAVFATIDVAGQQAVEIDTASAGIGATNQVIDGTQAVEVDTANAGTAVAGGASVQGVQAVERDTANPGTFSTVVVIAGQQAVERDTASSGVALVVILGQQSAERDIASSGAPVVGVVVVQGTQAVERDTAVTFESTGDPTAALSLNYASQDRFMWTIAHSHRIATRATLVTVGEDIELTTIMDGTVTCDAKAAVRRRCDVTLTLPADSPLIPADPADPITPYGNEIKLERGVYYPDGTTEHAPLGVFQIRAVDIDDTGDDFSVRINGFDRAQRIIDARFEAPYQIASGTNLGVAILTTIQEAYPTVEYSFPVITLSTTATLIVEEGADRWDFCQKIATSMGMDLYFDANGILVLTPLTVTESAWHIVEGRDGVLLRVARNWTREGTYNRVIATGENLGDGTAPVRGVATDDDPNSPTYYNGPYGRMPMFFSSEFLTTNAQCDSAAAGLLLRQLGTTQVVSFGSLVNPKLKPGDLVTVTRGRARIDEQNIIDSLTIPLGADASMSGQTRAVVV